MSSTSGSGSGGAGKLIGVIVVWALLATLGYGIFTWLTGTDRTPENRQVPAVEAVPSDVQNTPPPSAERTKVGIAYGTEKRRWLQAAMERWAETPEADKYEIDLIPMGSVEGARAVVDGDERIHVWSPASGMYRAVFEQDWALQHGGGDAIARSEQLALTPMVFVFWKERHDAFADAFAETSFNTIAQAAANDEGWQGIAQKPEWGYFKFGHTHPNKSNSGLMTLVLMAYDHADKTRDLAQSDVLGGGFQDFIEPIEKANRNPISSTGTLMKNMVLRGPSTYDATMVYESVALDYAENAAGRYGEIRVVYPPVNVWNDNPYYILNASWSTDAHKAGATSFLEFLMSEPIQKLALDHGFRPGNPAVATNAPDSPFVRYASFGVRPDDIGTLVDFPDPAVLKTLQEGWERRFGG